MVGFVVLGAVVALRGTVSLPLDGHEALVVETAQEMRQRDEWIVPYYNGEPRLNKPPLSYWLTRFVAAATGSADRVQPWHGRLPSVLSGLALIVVLAFLGQRLFDPSTAVVAAALGATSVAFFSGTHDGRCDLLYTLCCGLGIAAFVQAWTSHGGTRSSVLAVYAMWAAWGLATLAKGPHLPLMFLAAIALFCLVRAPSRRAALLRLRPLTGMALAALLSVPWWVALQARIGRESLSHSQLAGSLLVARWDKILDPYYLYASFAYVLPWIVLVPAAARIVRRRELRSDAAWLLMLLLLVPVLSLSAGPQKRLVYVLPVWVPLTVLLAAGAVSLLRAASAETLARFRRWFVPAHVALAMIAAAVVALSPGSTSSRLLAVAAIIAGGAILLARPSRLAATAESAIRDLLLVAGVAGVVFAAAGDSTVVFDRTRYEKVRLAALAREAAGPDVPLVAIQRSPSPYVYYTRRRIDEVASTDDLAAWIERSPRGEAVALIATELVPRLPPSLRWEVIGAFDDPDDASTLLRIRRAAGSLPLSEPPR